MVDLDRFWQESSDSSGVTKQQIAAWEAKHAVTLPKLLRKVLRLQNGGYVRGTQFRIEPLESIQPIDQQVQDFWEWASFEEEEIPDTDLVFLFGDDDELGGQYLLNFNARGPQEEPAVCQYYSDPGDVDRVAKSLSKFFEKMLASSDEPAVAWSDSAQLELLISETIDLSDMYGGPATMEQIFGRQGEHFVLMTRECTPEGEKLMKASFAAPLDPNMASIELTLGDTAFWLHLAPEDTDTMLHVESQKTAEGRWKNEESHGVPMYVSFISRDQEKLQELRHRLHGDAVSQAHTAQEADQAELLARMASMSESEQRAVFMQRFVKMREQIADQVAALDPADCPPELAGAAQILQQRLEEIQQHAEQTLAENPVAPDVAALLDRLSQRGRNVPGA